MILELESIQVQVGPSTSFSAGDLGYFNANGEAVKLTANSDERPILDDTRLDQW